MKKTNGPFRVIEARLDCENQPDHYRNYDCNNYSTCLNLAAALNWDSFHCYNCSEEVASHLLTQAKQAQRTDKVAGQICELPDSANIDETALLKCIVNK